MAKPSMNKHDPRVNARANFRGLMATVALAVGVYRRRTDRKEQEGDTEACHSTKAADNEAKEAEYERVFKRVSRRPSSSCSPFPSLYELAGRSLALIM
jgi:hypothetical protein